METKKLVFNNEQYNILTSIKMGQTAFLICIDVLDKKVIYFKQEVVDGKVKLTSQANILPTANEVNKKSLSNKIRILEAFLSKVHLGLANAVFVDRKKVSDAFHNLTAEIDNCDLKYYMIENASIEETDEQIENFIVKFNGLNFNKELEQVNEIKNELYYYNPNEEKEVTPKVEAVSNVNKIENVSKEEENTYVGPSMAEDPFKTGAINLDEIANKLTQNQSVDEALNKHLEQYAPKKDEESYEATPKSKKLNTILIVIAILAVGASLYFTFFNKEKTYTTKEIMEKVNAKANLKEISKGKNYNAPDNLTSNYKKALDNKLISVNIPSIKTINADTVGWIKNDFLNVSYPIVKGTTNAFYSNHDFMKKSSNGGWIYVDSATDLNKIERNNVIYGKSDVNSTFFYSLRNVLTADFVKDINNQVIKISTTDANTLWLVFSVYEIPNEDYYLKNDFNDDDEFIEFINTINERSIHDFEVDLDEYDKILTLTTNKDNENRIIVHAKLIKIDGKQEEIEEKDEKQEKDEEIKEEEKKTDESKEEQVEVNNKEEDKKGEN